MTGTPTTGAPRSSSGKGRRIAGYALHVTGEIADGYGAMALFVVCLTPLLVAQQPGTSAIVPVAALLAAFAIWQPPARALVMLVGLVGALGLCAASWPVSPYVAVPCVIVAMLLKVGARGLGVRLRRIRIGGRRWSPRRTR